MSISVYLFFPPRGHEPPPTLRNRFNPHLSLQRRRFPIPRYAKHLDVAVYTIGPLFLFPTPSSPHCTLKVSKHDSQSLIRIIAPVNKHSRAQRCLNALTPGCLRARFYEVIRWSGLLRCVSLMRSKTRWCTVREVWRNGAGEGSSYCIHTGGPRLPRPLPFGS